MGGVIAQEESTSGEFNVHPRNNYDDDLVTISMHLVGGACWFADNYYPDLHEPTAVYPGTTRETSSDGHELAWEACWSEEEPGDFLIHAFGLGKYKITAKINGEPKDWFWIDWRNDQLSEHFNDVEESGDINVEFDVETEKFYWNLSQNDLVNKADTTWGEVNGWQTTTSKLIPYSPDNFNLTTYNNHPKLTWNHSYEDDYITGYEIYRCVGNSCRWGSYTLIDEVSATTTSYVDTDFLDGGKILLKYYIRAKNSSVFSEPTSTLSTNGALYKKSSKNNIFSLLQNYPNPFNPTTKIKYQIARNSFVELRVYDSLGQEVAELVNEKQTAGEYQINFNGENLPSGIYIYRIAAGKYSDTKKLLLVK